MKRRSDLKRKKQETDNGKAGTTEDTQRKNKRKETLRDLASDSQSTENQSLYIAKTTSYLLVRREERKMNQQEFIDTLKIVVHDAAINGVIQNLSHPRGRRPHRTQKRLSDWFNDLQESDKQIVKEVIRQAVHAALFSTLCVLDGVVAIDSPPQKGELKLLFIKNGETEELNHPEMEMLHDLYQINVQDEVFGE